MRHTRPIPLVFAALGAALALLALLFLVAGPQSTAAGPLLVQAPPDVAAGLSMRGEIDQPASWSAPDATRPTSRVPAPRYQPVPPVAASASASSIGPQPRILHPLACNRRDGVAGSA
jgi:hypothetical protein